MTDLLPDLPKLHVGRQRDVLRAPHAALATTCIEVDPHSDDTVALAADLLATMDVSPGCVGLAANQIGVSARVFCLDVSAHPKARTCHGRFVLVNPVIEVATRKERAREGCMSVPDFTGDVRRASRLEIRGYLPGTAEPVLIKTDAFEARAIQHEVDHLDGLLFVDRVVDARALHPRQTYL
ncbi:MAG: peptide deformylase [Candidatus Nanopelagicales bacterium]